MLTFRSSLSYARAFAPVVLWLAYLTQIPGQRLRAIPYDPPSDATETSRREPRYSISTKVEDDSGASVPGATVRAFATRNGSSILAGEAAAEPSGTARVANLGIAEYWVVVDANGHARGSAHVPTLAHDETVRVRLSAEHVVHATVQDDAGAAVSGAEVEVTGASPFPCGGRSDENGVTDVRGLGLGPYRINVRKEGYETTTLDRVSSAATVVLSRLGSLTVRVVDATGNVIPNAHLLLSGAALWPYRAVSTDGVGVAYVPSIPAGYYALRASAERLVSKPGLGVDLRRGERRDAIAVLAPGVTLSVAVYGRDHGQEGPLPGARLAFAEGGLSPFPTEGVTGENGRAELGPVAKGSGFLTASLDGYLQQGQSVSSDQPEVRFVLDHGATLRGTVRDGRGFAVLGASLEVVGEDASTSSVMQDPLSMSFREAHFRALLNPATGFVPGGSLGVTRGPVPPIPHAFALPQTVQPQTTLDRGWVTRRTGAFELSPVAPGRLRVLARHPAYVQTMSDEVVVSSGGEATVDIVMRSGGSLSGVVSDAEGRSVEGATVRLGGGEVEAERSTLTAADGSFSFANVEGDLIVRAARGSSPGQPEAQKAVHVSQGEQKSVVLRLAQSRMPVLLRVSGARGYPVARAEVRVTSLEPGTTFEATLFSDRNGEVTVDQLRGAPARIVVRAPGYADDTREVLSAPPQWPIEMTSGSKVDCVVRDGRGMPVLGAVAWLQSATSILTSRVGSSGGLNFANVHSGDWTLRIKAPHFAAFTKTFSVPNGRDAEHLGPVELADEGRVEGIVVTANGVPVAGARISEGVAPVYESLPGIGQSATADGRGLFALGGLSAGPAHIEAYSSVAGRGAAEVRVEKGRTTRDARIVVEAETGPRPTVGPATVAVTLGESRGEGQQVAVAAVSGGSTAERAGILAGDTIVDIDGVPVDTLESARKRLDGPPGIPAVIALRRGDSTVHVSVRREVVRK